MKFKTCFPVTIDTVNVYLILICSVLSMPVTAAGLGADPFSKSQSSVAQQGPTANPSAKPVQSGVSPVRAPAPTPNPSTASPSKQKK